jgi:uncharacterized protein YacL
VISISRRTSNSTISVVIGGVIGEAIAPFLVSVAIAHFGPTAFSVSICFLVAALVLCYLALHFVLKHTDAVHYGEKVRHVLRVR